MSLHTPDKILDISIKNGIKKTSYPLLTTLILGFQAGAFIALGFCFIYVSPQRYLEIYPELVHF